MPRHTNHNFFVSFICEMYGFLTSSKWSESVMFCDINLHDFLRFDINSYIDRIYLLITNNSFSERTTT